MCKSDVRPYSGGNSYKFYFPITLITIKDHWRLLERLLEITGYWRDSLAASPSPPGRSQGRAAKRRAVGREGLANFALDQVFLECQLRVTCEPVKCQFKSRTSSVPWEAPK